MLGRHQGGKVREAQEPPRAASRRQEEKPRADLRYAAVLISSPSFRRFAMVSIAIP